MADSRRAHSWSTSQNFCCQCPCPCGEPQPPPTSAGDPPTLPVRSGSISYGVIAPLPSVLMHTLLCVCPPRVESVSPSPVKILQSNPTSLQSLFLWEFLLLLPDSQVGKRDMGHRTFTPAGVLRWYNCSALCESPTQTLWDLILL